MSKFQKKIQEAIYKFYFCFLIILAKRVFILLAGVLVLAIVTHIICILPSPYDEGWDIIPGMGLVSMGPFIGSIITLLIGVFVYKFDAETLMSITILGFVISDLLSGTVAIWSTFITGNDLGYICLPAGLITSVLFGIFFPMWWVRQ